MTKYKVRVMHDAQEKRTMANNPSTAGRDERESWWREAKVAPLISRCRDPCAECRSPRAEVHALIYSVHRPYKE